jgi:hypothetical protein
MKTIMMWFETRRYLKQNQIMPIHILSFRLKETTVYHLLLYLYFRWAVKITIHIKCLQIVEISNKIVIINNIYTFYILF